MASRSFANPYTIYDRLCKVEGCTRELCLERPYYHRLGICAAHVREPHLLIDGQLKRFCQQCAKIHDIDDFDLDKRSCRLMLERHRMRQRLLKAKKTRLERLGHQEQDSQGQGDGTDSDDDGGPTTDLRGTSSLLGRRIRGPAQQSSKARQSEVHLGTDVGKDRKAAGKMVTAGRSPSPRSTDEMSGGGGSRGSNGCQVEIRTPPVSNDHPAAYSGLVCNSVLKMPVQHCSPDVQVTARVEAGLDAERAIEARLDKDHSQKAVLLSPSQHPGLVLPTAVRTLAPMANMAAVQQDTTLDIELAAILSGLEAQPVQYMRGLNCLARVQPQTDALGNTYDENHYVFPSNAIGGNDGLHADCTLRLGHGDSVGATLMASRAGYEGPCLPHRVVGGLSSRAEQALHAASSTGGPVLSASLQPASLQTSSDARTFPVTSVGCEPLGKTDTSHQNPLRPRLIQAWPGPKDWPQGWPGPEPPPTASIVPAALIAPMQLPHRQAGMNPQLRGQGTWAAVIHPTGMPVAGGELEQHPVQPSPYREQQHRMMPMLQGQQLPRQQISYY